MKEFDRRRLVGAWELERWSLTRPDGSTVEPLGAGARGLLVFTPDGWATITITAGGRPSLSRRGRRAAPVAARAAAFDGIVAYCCRWRVVGRTVELQVLLSQNPAMEGTVQVRRLRMRGRVLEVFSTDGSGGVVREHCLRWRPAVAPAGPGTAASKSTRSGNQP